MATLLKPITSYRSEFVEIQPKNGTNFKLEELYKHLECEIIEVLHFGDNTLLIIDEEGKLNDKTLNSAATHFFRKEMKTNDFIVGNAIICEKNQLT